MLIYRGLAGSQLYGTATPESDIDYIEVHLPTLAQIFGLGDKYASFKQTLGEEDISRFGVNQFMRLLARGNPNALETMFCPENRIEYIHPSFRRLIAGEEQTMSGVAAILRKTSVVKAHLGFAIQQSGKMLPAKAKYAGPRRTALFDKYGYDTKYAAHAIRLVYQCRQLLQDGYIEYPYPQSMIDHLLKIRNGERLLVSVREEFARELTIVQEIGQTQCVITDDDKSDVINQRLLQFYIDIGYALG